MADNVKFFLEKYEKTNLVTKKLLRNFFQSVADLISEESIVILETACGGGYSLRSLREHKSDAQWFASDIDPELVKLAKKINPGISITEESIYELNRESSSVDLVLALEVLEHLENPEQALRELNRVTNRFAIISVPREPLWKILNMVRLKYFKEFGNTPGHINHWNVQEIKDLVKKYFVVEAVKTPLPWTVLLLRKK